MVSRKVIGIHVYPQVEVSLVSDWELSLFLTACILADCVVSFDTLAVLSEKERQTDRGRQRQRETQAERERHRERHRQRERHRERHTQTERRRGEGRKEGEPFQIYLYWFHLGLNVSLVMGRHLSLPALQLICLRMSSCMECRFWYLVVHAT